MLREGDVGLLWSGCQVPGSAAAESAQDTPASSGSSCKVLIGLERKQGVKSSFALCVLLPEGGSYSVNLQVNEQKPWCKSWGGC